MARTLAQRIHNPYNYQCGCRPECWCNRTAIGRLVKWWFPARRFGIRHDNAFFDGMTTEEIRVWKQEQDRRGMSSMVAQPRYESLVRLGRMRYGLTVRSADGTRVIHEMGGSGRIDASPSQGRDTVKRRALERDPRVSLCVENGRPPFAFVQADGCLVAWAVGGNGPPAGTSALVVVSDRPRPTLNQSLTPAL